ncbi:uncharacterized protein LOC131859344 [Cryptomeria japonica]|uniref:uncharacterized protein LOC131859344 n=1 Tax=Cryptomeria japonica TaxID=3369 RepID=UPI0027DA0926|nr:uncharacterized protein LOC131859344 [Cryptomeria japonica]
MRDDEKIDEYFLRIHEVVNGMRGLGEEVDEFTMVKKVIRTLLPKYETRVSALEEKKFFNKLTLDDLQGSLIDFEMRTSKVDNGRSSLKETTFKREKKEDLDSESELSDSLEALLVRKLKKKYRRKLLVKCFNCGKVGHFATQCSHADQNNDDDQNEKHYEKKIFSPKKKFNFNDFKKKKSLFNKKDFDDELDDSLGDEGETLLMPKIDMPKISSSKAGNLLNSQSDLENCEINLEGELLCALQEIRKLKKHISSQEKLLDHLTIFLQTELDDSKRVIENLKSILSDKEKEIQTLEQQVGTLTKQMEKHDTTIHLHNMLGKQRQLDSFDLLPSLMAIVSFVTNLDTKCNTVGHTPDSEIKISLLLKSGCSNHMTGDKDKFLKLEDYVGGFVKFGDDSGIEIKGRGSLLLNDDTPIHDVLIVEGR